jgi:hypothetical protein
MNYLAEGKWILLICFATMASAGCVLFVAGAGVGAGVGGAEYVHGELKQAYAAPMEKAWKASLATVDELKMKTAEKWTDNLDQNRAMKGKTDEGKDFQIALEAMSKDVTMVKVRIGLFGDEAASKRIQEVIAKNLKK